jgi:S1-C subfamily serine protease
VTLATVAAAQTSRRATPNLLNQIPDGLVYVSQPIDLSQQIGAADSVIWTLDGEAPPRMQTTNVTLGVVIDNAGYIVARLAGVTPNNPPQDVKVTLPRGRPTPAKFIGLDVVTGLCVLKVDDPAFKAPVFTRASVLPSQLSIRLLGFHPKQGQSRVRGFAILKPRINEFTGRLTKARSDFRYSASNPIYYLLAPQLTPVQDGSLVAESDGPIFGLAVYDTTGEGRNLVYPITRVRMIAQTVISANGSIVHGWLGATGIDPPITINRPTVAADRGVRVTGVVPDSPAWAAGIKLQDVLLSINGRPVDSVAKLTTTLKQLPADSEITLKAKRGNEYKILQAKLTPAPAVGTGPQINVLIRQLDEMEKKLETLAATDPEHNEVKHKVVALKDIIEGTMGLAHPEARLRALYGFEVQPLTAQLAKYFAVPSGVLVLNVAEGNKAARAGMFAGDVILKIGEHQVTDLTSVMRALDESTTDTVEITVSRQRAEVKLTFPR